MTGEDLLISLIVLIVFGSVFFVFRKNLDALVNAIVIIGIIAIFIFAIATMGGIL